MKKKLRGFGGLMLAVVMALSLFITAVGADSPNDKIRVLIEVERGSDVASVKAQYGERWDFGAKGFTTDVTPQQYQQLSKLDHVTISKVPQVSIIAKPGTTATRTVPSDQTPWGMEAIYNNSSITSTTGGAGIRVAVLDTGALISHVDLEGNAEQCKDFSSARGLVNGQCDDKNGHGTHVSGTILANAGSDKLGIWGVAPESKLWAYKVLGNSGFGSSDDIAAAIMHAADEGVRLGVKVVISMSLGSSTKSGLIADASTYAVSKGALVVAAAGNSGPDDDTIGYPGALADVVGVAALENVQENGTYRIADFSSRGNPATAGDYVIVERDVEVSAPGRAVESTWSDGTYNTISGTSMATPHISGLAAKIWATNPSWTTEQVRAELQSRAKNNDILGGISAASGDDIASGFGFPTVSSTDK
jgi:subtilisin